jgi:hypothetical protein
MTFGDYPKFAFQCVIDWDVSKRTSYLFGHSCFWVAGEIVGDFSDSNILALTVSNLEDFANREAGRAPQSLHGRSSTEVLCRVMAGYYNFLTPAMDSETTEFLAEASAHSRQWRDCIMLNGWGENFDHADAMVLVNEADIQRLIWGKWDHTRPQFAEAVREITLPAGTVERTLRLFVDWYAVAEETRQPRFGQGDDGGFNLPAEIRLPN